MNPRTPLPILHILGVLALFGMAVVMGRVLIFQSKAHRTHNSAPQEPRTIEEYNLRGNSFYEEGAYKRAARDYTRVIELAPNRVEGYQLRGMASLKLGDFGQAVADDTKVLELQPSQGTGALYLHRGRGYKGMGQWDKAIADLDEALRRDPENYEVYGERASCYAAKGDNEKALRDYGLAIAHNPNDVTTILQRIRVYFNTHDYAHALSDVDRCLALTPDSPQLYTLRAQIHDNTHEYAKSAMDYEKLTQIVPNNAVFRGNLGWFQYLAGQLPEAIVNSKMALDMNPGLFYARYNLGLCYATQGDWKAAEPEYRSALAYAGPDETKGALKDVQDALLKQPHSHALKQALALLSKGGQKRALSNVLPNARR